MAEKLTTFVWRHSKRDQLVAVAIVLCTFPLIWASLQLPKEIINDAIGGENFPREIIGFEFEQEAYLLLLCFAYLAVIAVNNTVKFVQNLQRGVMGERMLRRMRFDLFRRVMGRPLRRLRGTSPGELVQMISAELAPIGDFIGAIFITPVSSGGQFLVNLTFIVVQNPLIGAAAMALYPVQAYIVPKLQAKVVAMIRVRLANIRAMAREINESIDGAVEIRALRSRRWHMAVVSRQLYDNYQIRRRIFVLKFLIKFVNNVANHLTPFFIFLIGGWFVIKGQLDIGALTAVLIAYKDLGAPWKDLLAYYQSYSDITARYSSVMENFAEDGEPAPLLDRAPVGDAALTLKDARVDGIARPVSCRAPNGMVTAILADDPAVRSALTQTLAGSHESEESEQWTAATPVLYRAAGYASADPRVFTGTVRSNLLEGLRFRPVRQADDHEAAERRAEAAYTGAPEDDLDDDWIDAEESGYADKSEVENRMLQLASRLGLEDDLYTIGLGSRLDPETHPRMAEDILRMRRTIAKSEELGAMREDFIDIWKEDVYVANGTVAENLFFALPKDGAVRWPDLAGDRAVLSAIDGAGVRTLLVEIGADICETLLSLFEGVAGDSDLLKRYGMFPKSETPLIQATVLKFKQRGAGRLSKAEQVRMIAIAFDYCSARFRLSVMRGGGRVDDLLAARPKLRRALADDPRIAFFDPDAYMPAFTLAENLFFGPVRTDRRDSWGPFKSRVDTLAAETGLRDAVLHAGLDQPVGEGGVSLNARQRRRLALARALLKKPGALVLDGIAATESEEDAALRRLLRREIGDGALVYATDRPAAVIGAHHLIRVDDAGGGKVLEGPADDYLNERRTET